MLINGEKWACETCIKGHRASHCKHTNRQLIQIKKKGRPSTQCSRCKELRIVRQLHVKCNCSPNSDSSNSDDSKRKDSSNNSTGPKKKRRTTKLRPLAPKEATPKSGCCSSNKTQPVTAPSPIYSIPSLPSTSTCTTFIETIASLAPVPSPPLTSPSCGNTTQSPIPSTSSCCSSKTPSVTTPKISSCCSSKATAPVTTSTIAIPNELDHYDGNYYSTNNYSQSPPIQNPTPPQEEQEEENTLPPKGHTAIYDGSNPPSPYIPPPTSCCGPPTKNKNGENIRIVTCRCGDSCACPGCDAHPSRAMKEGTKDVYYGFEAVTTDMLGRRRISISRICSSSEDDEDTPSRQESATEPAVCGCGCAQLFENCSGCFNDLCQCNFL